MVNSTVIALEGHSGSCGGEEGREEDTTCEGSPQNSGQSSEDEKKQGNQEA